MHAQQAIQHCMLCNNATLLRRHLISRHVVVGWVRREQLPRLHHTIASKPVVQQRTSAVALHAVKGYLTRPPMSHATGAVHEVSPDT